VRPPVAAVVAALVAAAALAGCASGPGEEQRVAATVRDFASASAAHDYGTLCRRILAPSLIQDVTSIGLSCERALARGLGDVRDPALAIGAIGIAGDRATAEVKTSAADQRPATDTVRLVKVRGHWRIASLAR
jgi:hypothetical protein